MRTIKFRGKRTDNGDWVYGSVYYAEYGGVKTVHIIEHGETVWYSKADDENLAGFVQDCVHDVIPETVGQYTILKDKNGVEIYEGDVVRFIGGTCDFLPCALHYSHSKNQILCVRSLQSGFTLCLPEHHELNSPSEIRNVDNYTFWSHAASLLIIGNIHDNPELLTPQPETK